MTLVDEIAKYAERYNVPSHVALAVAKTESNNTMPALRYEPAYKYLWDNANNRPFRGLSADEVASPRAPKGFAGSALSWAWYCSADTEWQMQKVSWGPFQIMGAVLRENGYIDPFPRLCCDESLAALWGCRHLSMLKDRYYQKHGWTGVVAAYNAGRPRMQGGKYVNQDYVNKVARNGATGFVHIA